jgi:hypothetical protein
MSIPQRKHITSPLRAQPVNAIYRSVTVVYYGHYPSTCLLFKHDVSKTGFCLQVEPNHWGPEILLIQLVSDFKLALSIESIWVRFAWRRRHNPVSETLRLKWKAQQWIISKVVLSIKICYHEQFRWWVKCIHCNAREDKPVLEEWCLLSCYAVWLL